MPTLTEILAQINSEIVPNGSGDITANVLNPILVGMLQQINDLTGVLEDLTTDDISSLVAAINSLSNSNEYYSLKIPLINSVENGDNYLFPALNRGESRVVAVVNNKGVFNPDGSFRLGGTSGVIAGHYTWVIALVNSTGGTFAEVGHQFLIINQKRPTVIYQADEFGDLPPAGNVYTIYWVLDTGNTYIWNNNDNEYELVGSVVEGTLIDEHTFEDSGSVVVAPDGSKVYFDTTDEIYYRWNGDVYVPINFSEGGGGGEVDYSSLTDNVLPKKSSGTNALEDSNITDTTTGISVDGRTKTNITIEKSTTANIATTHAFDLNTIGGAMVFTMTGNTMFSFTNMISDTESTVFDFLLTGAFAPSWASGATKTLNSDDYSGSVQNRVVVEIVKGGVSPVIYYSYENLT